MLFQEGGVDAITGDDTVLAGLAAQDPYAVVPEQEAFTAEPYGIGVNAAAGRPRPLRQRPAGADAGERRVDRDLRPVAALGARSGSDTAASRVRPVTGPTVTAPPAPGRLGAPVDPAACLAYLSALGDWRDARKSELDLLDQAALESRKGADVTDDIALSMVLWKAASDRYEQLAGRVGLGPGRSDRA